MGLIEAFRWSVIATPAPQTFPMVYSIALSVVLLVISMVYFSRVAREFADVAITRIRTSRSASRA